MKGKGVESMRKLSTGARCGRWVLMAALALSAGLASGRAVPSPPASEWADAEASTNVPLAVSAADLAKLRVRIDLAAGPTNAVTVAVGFDSDGDGALSPSEEGAAFGCDCGAWFARRADGSVVELGEAAPGRDSREISVPIAGSAADWNLIRVVRNGAGPAGESVTVDGIRRCLRIIVR